MTFREASGQQQSKQISPGWLAAAARLLALCAGWLQRKALALRGGGGPGMGLLCPYANCSIARGVAGPAAAARRRRRGPGGGGGGGLALEGGVGAGVSLVGGEPQPRRPSRRARATTGGTPAPASGPVAPTASPQATPPLGPAGLLPPSDLGGGGCWQGGKRKEELKKVFSGEQLRE